MLRFSLDFLGKCNCGVKTEDGRQRFFSETERDLEQLDQESFLSCYVV